MVMRYMLVPEDSTLCFACHVGAVIPLQPPATPEEEAYFITSWKNKKDSVVKMVCKPFNLLWWNCENWPLNKKTSVRANPVISFIPNSKFCMEILPVCVALSQFLVRVMDSGHAGGSVCCTKSDSGFGFSLTYAIGHMLSYLFSSNMSPDSPPWLYNYKSNSKVTTTKNHLS